MKLRGEVAERDGMEVKLYHRNNQMEIAPVYKVLA